MYALIALGYTMVYGVLRFINFAHGEVFMVGGMIGYVVAGPLSRTSLWTEQPVVSLAIVLLAAMAASTGVAVLLERVAYRPLRGAPRLVPFITAIGASFFLQYAIAGLFGAGFKSYPSIEGLKGNLAFAGFRVLKTQAARDRARASSPWLSCTCSSSARGPGGRSGRSPRIRRRRV